ncbi:hypothetical protein GCM10022214_44840 [Actinomadura miaoliensis]|uniref:Uncharacterized protein n=1 Tax=Actinomadura miaoliensis TaxID=430685 RepID=A0ABP7W4Y3_9ACTN
MRFGAGQGRGVGKPRMLRKAGLAGAQGRPGVVQPGDRLLVQFVGHAEQLCQRHGGQLGVVRDDLCQGPAGEGPWRGRLDEQVEGQATGPPEHVFVTAEQAEALVRRQAVAVAVSVRQGMGDPRTQPGAVPSAAQPGQDRAGRPSADLPQVREADDVEDRAAQLGGIAQEGPAHVLRLDALECPVGGLLPVPLLGREPAERVVV